MTNNLPFPGSGGVPGEHHGPQSQQDRLATELAERLDDPNGLRFYRKITRIYAEPYIRQILHQALAFDERLIRKSRGALFTWLLHRTARLPSQPTVVPDINLDNGMDQAH